MSFHARDLSLQLVQLLRDPAERIRLHSAAEAKQLVSASTSIVRSVCEGSGRFGRDRLHLFSIAYGSQQEAKGILDAAVALGWLAERPAAYEVAHRLGGILWRLMRPRVA